MALKSNPEGFESAPQLELSFNQKPYEVYSNELDIADKYFKFDAKQGNHDLKFKAKFINDNLYTRLKGITNNNSNLLDIKGKVSPRSPREMNFRVKFKQSKTVDISFKDNYEDSTYQEGWFQIKANGESQVDIKFAKDEKEKETKVAMTSKIPNFEEVVMTLKEPPTGGKVISVFKYFLQHDSNT